MKKLAHGFNTVAHDSNTGPLRVRSSTPEPLRMCTSGLGSNMYLYAELCCNGRTLAFILLDGGVVKQNVIVWIIFKNPNLSY